MSAHQIGCILGKGGAVISEMRNSTGAFICILGKDQTPQYAAENEEVVQVCYCYFSLSISISISIECCIDLRNDDDMTH